MLSRLIDGCSIRQAARHVASIMARRKIENNVTWFDPNGWREHFGPESLRCNQLKLVLRSSKSHGQTNHNQSPIMGHFVALVILHWQFQRQQGTSEWNKPILLYQGKTTGTGTNWFNTDQLQSQYKFWFGIHLRSCETAKNTICTGTKF